MNLIDTTRYAARRARLISQLGDGFAIVPTASTKVRNGDADYAYRFDSDFHYLCGFPEPNAILVMVGGDTPRSILFCQAKNVEMEIWEGFIYGPDAAREVFGVDEARLISDFDRDLPALLAGRPQVFFPVGADAGFDQRIYKAVATARQQARSDALASVFVDVRTLTAAMRLIKDEHEIAIMREAGRISADAHIRAMRNTRPGMMEYEVEAELLYHFYRHGSRAPAYNSIVAGGKNATCLHYGANDQRLNDGELLLIDAGCELQGYAADITRTFPVNGKFTGPQRDVYQLVLTAMQASFTQIKPGARRIAYHDAAVRVLTQGLVDLGVLKGEVDGLIEQKAFRQFYMHGTGHWLGLDVHDAGEYTEQGESVILRPGMALTVEPGLYFRPADNVPAHFVDIGIRIEDDLVVTDGGYINLTEGVPKAVDEIEALMALGPL
ncbi:Xaa-Pro aminopeptidase [Burkholderiaceae bacterium DAT-1]|nr:Xaa-Pro aminopeptidase [Burkholderiaceae bacterium DAT-1]